MVGVIYCRPLYFRQNCRVVYVCKRHQNVPCSIQSVNSVLHKEFDFFTQVPCSLSNVPFSYRGS